MTYTELLERLVGARRFGVKLGLERMQELLEKLGNPEAKLGLVIHVGGTNGKGSVVAMIAAMVRAAGLRVATYTSPHLSTLRERIQIDLHMASEAQIVDAAEYVSANGGDELTFFEQITAIAMLVMAAARPDVTVLEVGLGGRLDATNVVNAPVAVVTGVAMDHEAILGSTLEAIAFEKAGIFKPGQRAIIGMSGEPAAVPVLQRLAQIAASVEVITEPASVEVGLSGEHQQRNAAAAIAAVRAAGLPVVTQALVAVNHPGRFERIDDLILDGAHNPHGARALAVTLRSHHLKPVLVLAVSADKDARAIVQELVSNVTAIVATRYAQDRALPPAQLAELCRETGIPVHTADDLRSAVELARSLGELVLVAGSLFLVGEARVAYANAPADPIRVSDPPASTR